MKPIQLQQLLAWVHGATLKANEQVSADQLTAYGVSTDTRSIMAGDAFVALKGERFDGHRFLNTAQQNQATLMVVNHDAPELVGASFDTPLLLVPHTGAALQQIAKGYRQQFDIPLVVVVGSNGKTTAKEMVHAIFKTHVSLNGKESAAHCTVGNFNNDIGLPLTLLRLNERHRYSTVELGMNHPGETAVLAAIAAPTIALINNAQREHQEFMQTVEAVAQEHAAVIAALSPIGVLVMPAQDTYALLWRSGAAKHHKRVIDFALHGEQDKTPAAVTGQRIENGLHQTLNVHTPLGAATIELRTAGEHNARNALAAIAVAIAASIPLASIVAGLASFEPVKGRMQQHVVRSATGEYTLIDDSYNANPDSVAAAINVLAQQAPSTLILGDMGEVGEQGEAFHREAGEHAAALGVGALYTVGTLSVHAHQAFAACGRACQHFADIAALNAFVASDAFEKSGTVLVKGSRFMRTDLTVDALLGRTPPPVGGH